MEPLVSVIIPVYNRENTLKRAIDSVLNQTYKNIELIIVDDASTDSSLQLAQEYLKDGVKVLTLPQNVGAAEARNRGMKEAEGEYIAFQDSDDEWFSEKLHVQINFMLHENVMVSCCSYVLQLNENICQMQPAEGKIETIKEQGIHTILHKENIVGTTPTLIMHKEVMENVGFFDKDFKSFEDYDYWIRISKKYNIGFIEQPLLKVYRTKVSLTTDKETYIEGRERILAKHRDFLDLEHRIKGIMMFHTYDYVNGFLPGLERMRKLYAGEDDRWKNHFDEVLLRALGQEYITMKRIQLCNEKSGIMKIREKEFAIYGAGYIGTNVYYGLKRRGIIPKMFIVSHLREEESQSIDDIPVIKICELDNKEIQIIVAVALETQEEILKNLNHRGFYNYFILDDPSILEDDSIFSEEAGDNR